MPYLIRKINRAKWAQIDINTTDDISADVFGACLRTSRNTLSIWRIESLTDLDDIATSIVSNLPSLDKIDLIIIDEEDLEKSGLTIEETDGVTFYSKMIKHHRDITSLRYSSLGTIKDIILKSLRDPAKVKKYTLKQVTQLLEEAVTNKFIDIEALPESLRKKITT